MVGANKKKFKPMVAAIMERYYAKYRGKGGLEEGEVVQSSPGGEEASRRAVLLFNSTQGIHEVPWCGGVFCGQKTGLDIRTPSEKDVRSHKTPPRSPPRGDGTNSKGRRRGEAAARSNRPPP